MTKLLNRLVCPLLVAVALGGALAPVAAATALPQIVQDMLFGVSAGGTGDFVAGQQALKDLRTTEAASFLAAAAREQWDNPMTVERAFIALAADGQIDEAATMASHLLELEPNNELAELVLGTQSLKQDKFSQTETILSAVGEESFTAITASILRAWAFIGDKQQDKADAVLKKLADNGLGDFMVFHRALMAEEEGHVDEAIDLAGKAYDAEPNVARIVEVYSRLLANNDKFDEAAAAIAGYEAQGLTHPVVTLVKQAIAKKQHPGTFTTSVQVGAAEMYHGIGVALSRDGNKELALVFLRLAHYLSPDADVIALAIGQLFDEAGQQAGANTIYDAIPTDSPMKPTAVVRVAQNLDVRGDRPEALRRLTNVVSVNPTDLDAVSVLGDMLRYDEKFVPAIDAYTKALALTGGENVADWRFYYVRGIAYERSKQWPKAEADFLKALKLNPDQPAVLNYLGYSWIDQDMHLDEALDMIQKAVNATPQDGYVVDSLGWAYYKLDRDAEAVATLEQAVQLMPSDPEINDHLGDAYMKVGRKLEARFQWTIAASVDTVGTVKARVEPKLAATQPPIISDAAASATPPATPTEADAAPAAVPAP